MGMYRCPNCNADVDDDWHPGEEGRRFKPVEWKFELICPSCVEELEEDEEAA